MPIIMFLFIALLAFPCSLPAQGPREQTYVEIVRLSELAQDAPIVLPKNAFFDGSGNLVMVDEAESRIAVLDSALQTIRTAGRRGDGPGEYQRPGPIGPVVSVEGGYAVWDRIQGRLTELDRELGLRRSLEFPVDFREHGFIESLYSTGDSAFVAAATTWPMLGYNEDSFTHVFLATRDSVHGSVAIYPGYDLLTDFSDPRFTTVLRKPFGAVTVIRFEGDGRHYWTGRTDSPLFSRVRVSDGAQVGVFELSLNGERVTSRDREEYLREQEGEFERIGTSQTMRVNVRIVAATSRRLGTEVEAGRFRLDLYYRLNVVTILLPPLRDRAEDLVPLVLTFLRNEAADELAIDPAAWRATTGSRRSPLVRK